MLLLSHQMNVNLVTFKAIWQNVQEMYKNLPNSLELKPFFKVTEMYLWYKLLYCSNKCHIKMEFTDYGWKYRGQELQVQWQSNSETQGAARLMARQLWYAFWHTYKACWDRKVLELRQPIHSLNSRVALSIWARLVRGSDERNEICQNNSSLLHSHSWLYSLYMMTQTLAA